ncbi:SDR family NAD(P)-dependent oxidoreductase [Nocardioides daejeonensis]|uniref:SDR family NAD(P)-dependent oxidoreductase n=1 Tax=Nocardioides daejeonensis TaxID=1046556 RepID=UPI000D74F737|nr:SDR family NAD(P)-dependent oxidoreductase [Nocardioides daejeonensis]
MTFPLPYAGHDLSGEVALVAGATSGLGHRFARVLAAAGATVVVTGRREDRIAALVDEVVTAGGSAVGVRLDVADPASIETCIGEVVDRVGVPQILVNNAGIPDAARAHKMTLDLVDRVLDTNVRGPWLLSTTVARLLIEAGLPGRIVNTSSMSAFHYAGEGAALYAVTKAAVNRMTESLAVEWARHGINVNAIAPGAFSSEMMEGMIARVGDITTGFPRQRLGDPAQLDSTLLYLVSPASEFVTGTIIKVDDGQTHR